MEGFGTRERGIDASHRPETEPGRGGPGRGCHRRRGGGLERLDGVDEEADDGYTVHALVSDQPGKADHTDPNLVNSWGITASSTSPWWVADNGMNVSTLYDGNGVAQPQPTALVVTVGGGPTGTVFNGSSGFVVSDGNGHSGPVRVHVRE